MLHLVPARADHAPLYHGWRLEKDLKLYNPQRELSLPELTARLARSGFEVIAPPIDEYRWFACLDTDGTPVATVSLKSVNWSMGHAEVGYHVAAEHFGKGIGTAACRLLIEKAWRETTLMRLHALIHVDNLPSQKLAERLGFVREGTLRQHVVINGRRISQHYYGLLRAEWARR